MIYSSPEAKDQEEEIDLTNSPEAKREKKDQEAETDLTNSPEDLITTPEWAPVYCSRALQTDEVLKLFAHPAKIDSNKVRSSLTGILLLSFRMI